MNEKIFYFFNGFAGMSETLDSLIVFLADGLPWMLIAFTLVYFIFIKRSAYRLFWVSCSVAVSAAVTEFLKWIIFRHPRPFIVLSDVTPLIDISAFGSFPSQHATIFAALATAMFLYNRKVGAWFIFFAIVIGLARIAAGIHFPIDILTGLLIGFLVTGLGYAIFKKFLRFIKSHIS